MANPFDTFDTSAAASGGNPFDTFDERKAQGPQLEFPDAPTTARMQLPGVAVWNGKDVEGNEGLSVGGKASTLFGTLMTDNPKARQQIYAKHLPGAKAVEDKYGNPMVEYKGEKFYTSRPGEFDGMDAGRLTAGVAASVPLMALGAPAGLAGMAAVGGATNVGMSLGEDYLTQRAGGEAQEIDLVKAGLSGAFGAALPPAIQKIATPIARSVYGRVAAPLVSETGNLTRHGQTVLRRAGIDAADLTPQQLTLLDTAYRRNFGSTPAIQQAERRMLGDEFGVGQTTGQITRTPAQVAAEDQMRHGGRGAPAQTVMRGADTAQQGALDEAGGRLRAQISGSEEPLNPGQIGERIQRGFNDANQSARTRVRDQYTRAFTPEELQARGVAPGVPIETINGLPNALEATFLNPDLPGGMLIPSRASTPTAYRAIQMLRRFSENGDIPSAFPRVTMPSTAAPVPGAGGVGPVNVTELGWQGVDMVRKQLVGLYRGAQGNPTDRLAMSRVMTAFDEHFGAANPLLNEARLAHGARMQTFSTQQANAAGTNAPLRTLSNENNPGQTIYNALFESGALKRGETGPLMRQLEGIFAARPEAYQAVREGALQRILVNRRNNERLSPQRAATAFGDALDGPQGEIYRALFSREERATLSRYGRLSQNVAETTARGNASGTSYPINQILNRFGPQAVGGAIGAAALSGFGPLASTLGLGAGGYVGSRIGDTLAGRAAQRAVNGAGLNRLARAPNALPPAYAVAPTFRLIPGLLN